MRIHEERRGRTEPQEKKLEDAYSKGAGEGRSELVSVTKDEFQ